MQSWRRAAALVLSFTTFGCERAGYTNTDFSWPTDETLAALEAADPSPVRDGVFDLVCTYELSSPVSHDVGLIIHNAPDLSIFVDVAGRKMSNHWYDFRHGNTLTIEDVEVAVGERLDASLYDRDLIFDDLIARWSFTFEGQWPLRSRAPLGSLTCYALSPEQAREDEARQVAAFEEGLKQFEAAFDPSKPGLRFGYPLKLAQRLEREFEAIDEAKFAERRRLSKEYYGAKERWRVRAAEEIRKLHEGLPRSAPGPLLGGTVRARALGRECGAAAIWTEFERLGVDEFEELDERLGTCLVRLELANEGTDPVTIKLRPSTYLSDDSEVRITRGGDEARYELAAFSEQGAETEVRFELIEAPGLRLGVSAPLTSPTPRLAPGEVLRAWLVVENGKIVSGEDEESPTATLLWSEQPEVNPSDTDVHTFTRVLLKEASD